MNRAEALKKLRTFAGALRARGATSLYLFGSTAKNKAGANSDLDLFIDYCSMRSTWSRASVCCRKAWVFMWT
jgi:predicted nucleotidyltransferase